MTIVARLKLYDTFYRASYASAVYAIIMCPSVCPSVRPSQIGVVQRWLDLGSRK